MTKARVKTGKDELVITAHTVFSYRELLNKFIYSPHKK